LFFVFAPTHPMADHPFSAGLTEDESPLLPSQLLIVPKKHSHGHGKKKKGHKHGSASESSCCDMKLISFVLIGGLTLIYVVAELGVAVWWGSLTLLSDGFHNLSDVVSLYIAFWAVQASKRESSDQMSYGWVRSEILGGLTNGCFLLSLCLYVALESIPRFVDPPKFESGWPFIIVAACGLGINTFGTIVFAFTGLSHGHSHSHGGGGHGHSHGHGDKKEKHGHSHGHGDKKKKKDKGKDKHGHSHGHGDKKEKHGHSHGHGDKKDKGKDKHGHSHGGHGHSHSEKKDKNKKKERKFDLNMWGVFIHYAGDMCSSAVVLVMGFIIHYVDEKWTLYIDPASSLLIVALILWTTIPLVRDCSLILLQSTPGEVALGTLREDLLALPGVESVHDLHVWQLTEGTVVCSVHVAIEEGTVWKDLVKKVKKVMHRHSIHSSTIQPEFVPRNHPVKEFCEENCKPGCEENWCCKKAADKHKKNAPEPEDDHLHRRAPTDDEESLYHPPVSEPSFRDPTLYDSQGGERLINL
jgi:zinc transporter 1